MGLCKGVGEWVLVLLAGFLAAPEKGFGKIVAWDQSARYDERYIRDKVGLKGGAFGRR